MWGKKSFTLTELLIAITIVGILAALALPNYFTIKEKSLDREAKASLALIRAAERIYKMEAGEYYPFTGSIAIISNINTNLKLSLSSGNWAYNIDNSLLTGIGTATRSGRTWTLDASGASEIPACTPPGSCL